MTNITYKPKHHNTPIKRLISIVIDRFLAAPTPEQRSIIEFFNWTIRNCYDQQLKEFYIEVRRRTLEVAK